MPVVGTCTLQIKNPKNDLCHNLPFIIISGDYIPLLGSQAAQQMQLITVQFDNIDGPNSNNCFSCSSPSPSPAGPWEPFSSPEAQLCPTANNATGFTWDYIMKQYANVFEGLGHMPGTLHLDVDATVQPVVMSPTPACPTCLTE